MTDNFKSGFAAIIGMPNVGKSTLLNYIAGQKIAIISNKPQTTRNKILAIHTTDTCQIVFTDTPGIHKPHNKLGEFMVKVANESMNEMDVVLFVVDATRPINEMEKEIDKLNQNKNIAEFMEAMQAFNDMMEQVNGIVGSYIAPPQEDGCSGNCSSCGGCH